jgi:hypothetical protein
VRDVILSPVPPALAIPLGIDAGRAALAAVRSVAVRMDAAGVVAPAVRTLLSWTTREDVAEVLGFQPLELLRRLLSRER